VELVQGGQLHLLRGFGRIQGDGFIGAQIYADPTFGACYNWDNMGFAIFAFFECTLWTNAYADLSRAWVAFGEVNGYWSILFVHVKSTIK